ncbi:MAG: linear amide C-N hydrolase [Ruminococcaceae bacterium]|nr:linear amide C-N hydrolase [Oscillospiraceae bacterium]
MCTAIFLKNKNSYFGRTLDLEYGYDEQVVITPKNYKFTFRHEKTPRRLFPVIGMATVVNGYPLYYDAMNNHGVAMAALNFPGNAEYFAEKKDFTNIAPFEFIPWILRRCKNMTDVREQLKNINITDTPFSARYPNTPLHWIIADKKEAITVESTAGGLMIYDNSIGVLANNPPFYLQQLNVTDNISTLPGDFESPSRFTRAAYIKSKSVPGKNETDSVTQFFHIMDTVSQVEGINVKNGKYVTTRYTSCMNQHKGIYYYTTYENRQISAVDINKTKPDSKTLITFPLVNKQQIFLHCVNK